MPVNGQLPFPTEGSDKSHIHIQETKISIPLDGKRLLPFLFRIGLGRLIVPPELNKDGLTSSAGCAGWPP